MGTTPKQKRLMLALEHITSPQRCVVHEPRNARIGNFPHITATISSNGLVATITIKETDLDTPAGAVNAKAHHKKLQDYLIKQVRELAPYALNDKLLAEWAKPHALEQWKSRHIA